MTIKPSNPSTIHPPLPHCYPLSTPSQVTKGGTPYLESSLPGINKPKVVPEGDGVRQFITATPAGAETLPQLLTTALSELCKEKPAGLDAVRWLGQWLLDNNPNQPQVEEPVIEEP